MTKFERIIDNYSLGDVISVSNWLTEDIVTLIQLMDAELQRRYDEEKGIRKECYESFQTDLFNEGDADDELYGREYDDRPY